MSRASLTVVLCLAAPVLLLGQSGYVPERVYHTGRAVFTDFESMLADISHADVVFVGEQHDDPNTHRLELAILEGLARRRGDVTVSLEMFERDVQGALDQFLMGRTSETDFLAQARPWPRYATDYKPLVDFAVARNWPVVAANVPRAIAAEVSQSGLKAIGDLPDLQKAWVARDLLCPTDDDYFARFAQAMSGHPDTSAGGGESAGQARQALERFYFAQCVKDETMGESIARAYDAAAEGGRQPLVVQFNGDFHSDFGEGTAARAARRLPGKRVVVLSILPVDNLDTLQPDATDRKRADFLIYTLTPPAR
jgi:uncharacterized iron-regulated protein